ncbi:MULTISPECIES: hypothetical protein [unclassified Caulobacter]|nr:MULTISPECIES: hypothetical protein [unclassified Caulobacter]
MTPQDIVGPYIAGLAPPRGFLAMVAVMLAAMAACFWTPELDPERILDE